MELAGAWVEAGQPYAEFWDLTLAEVVLVMKASGRAMERRQQESRAQAWQIATLAQCAIFNPKKLPDPGIFITGRRTRRRYATAAELEAFFSGAAAKGQTRIRKPKE